jgi:hypothetical protein
LTNCSPTRTLVMYGPRALSPNTLPVMHGVSTTYLIGQLRGTRSAVPLCSIVGRPAPYAATTAGPTGWAAVLPEFVSGELKPALVVTYV